jgi:hypothetical protein
MATEQVGDYEIDYQGVRLPEGEGWGAYVTIYAPSTNPMHRNSIVPTQRVAVDHTFETEDAAAAEARAAGLAMLDAKAV